MKGKINPTIFRAYDIRGIYGKDLDEEIMEKVGVAFSSEFVKGTVVVGMDGRNSSPKLKGAFIKGATETGKNVIDLGLVPRGVCMYWAWKKRLTSAYITASHLGKEYNGIKFAYDDGIELLEDDNNKVRDRVINFVNEYQDGKGKVIEEEHTKDYIDYILTKIKPAKKKLKVVIDCGNGTGGIVAPALFAKLGFTAKTIFREVDGSFPNRSSEISEENLSELKKEARGSDFGVAYDGDADRMTLIDENGRVLDPESVSFIILKELVREEKGPIIANVECLKIMDEIARLSNRDIHRIRVGNSFLVQAVKEKGACFGVEKSGHYCIPSILPLDDGIAASLYAASVLSRSEKKLSEIVDEIPIYPFKRIKIDCPDEIKFRVIENLKEKLGSAYEKVNTIDGVRADLDDGWILIRASNTEPLIRLSIEANDNTVIEKLSEKFLSLVNHEIREVKSS